MQLLKKRPGQLFFGGVGRGCGTEENKLKMSMCQARLEAFLKHRFPGPAPEFTKSGVEQGFLHFLNSLVMLLLLFREHHPLRIIEGAFQMKPGFWENPPCPGAFGRCPCETQARIFFFLLAKSDVCSQLEGWRRDVACSPEEKTTTLHLGGMFINPHYTSISSCSGNKELMV